MKKLFGIVLFALFWLGVACTPTAEIAPTPIPDQEVEATAVTSTSLSTSPTNPPTISQTQPTQTPTTEPTATTLPTETPTPTQEPTAVSTKIPINTATPEPTAAPTETAVPYSIVQDTTFPSQPIEQLWVSPATGRTWVTTATSLYTFADGSWQEAQPHHAIILGNDHETRTWFWLGDTLAYFGEHEGWQGVGPALDTSSLTNPEDEIEDLAVDDAGHVWIAHGRNGLHRFDPTSQQWETLRGEDVGYAPLLEAL
ncbi:hypothetical protein [Candidatus Leptofilum sp.]|uniref:hypothetical protein n=1 Tax=Candidatus Leptofilum sp. TaxID=3241576 RepID=UPI003B5B417F